MKVIVTGTKVFKAGKDGHGSIPIEIGTEIDIDGDVIPGYLVGKVDIVAPKKAKADKADEGDEGERVAVTNPQK